MGRKHIDTARDRRRRECLHGLAIAIAVVLIAPTFLQIAEAASFPCNAPTAPRERLICGDPALSRADEALAAAYKAALGAPSDAGREALRDGQRQWLAYTQTICWIGRKAPVGSSSRDCLTNEYANRQKQLEDAVVKRGDMVIRRVDRFSAATSSGVGSGGGHPDFNTTVISFPQIDKPRDEREAAWNKLIVEHDHAGQTLASATASASDTPDDDHDLSVDYVLGVASPTMISLGLLVYDDAHGAHGTASDEYINWLIREERAVRAEDVFDAHQAWGDALARRVFEDAKREAEKGGYELPYSEPSELIDAVSDPAHWLIGEHDLAISFDDGGPSCCSVVGATIPWSKLRPYLRTALPFTIAPD